MSSAEAKLGRAEKHLADLAEVLRATPPFVYVVGTFGNAKQRYIRSKRDEAAIIKVALLCGDLVHNLRSALDHVYWERVSPFAKTDKERRAIQFPFCDDAKALADWFKRQSVLEAVPHITAAIEAIRPYRDTAGNQMLCEVHNLDVMDKHKLLIPLAEVVMVHTDEIRAEVSDFPQSIRAPLALGANEYDLLWDVLPGTPRMPFGTAEQPLTIPVIPFIPRRVGGSGPLYPTLDRLCWVTRGAVQTLQSA